jgi:hypothetical protein
MTRISTLALSLTLLSAALGVGAEPLKVKPGLWETTTTTEKQGANKPTNLDQLTPEQRAKVEAQLAARVKKETHTVKSCLSAEQVKSAEAFMGSAKQHGCVRKVEQQTASDLQASIECRGGANPMSGKLAMHAVSDEAMTGRSEMLYGAPERLQLLTRSDISAKWLGARCVVAPAQAPHFRK